MATLCYETGMIRSQHLLFGLNLGIVVPRLTQRNWKKAALVNLREGLRVYSYIDKRKLMPDADSISRLHRFRVPGPIPWGLHSQWG